MASKNQKEQKQFLEEKKKIKWTDDLVKDFARVYTGSKDYWEYFNLKTIDKKLKHFKEIKNIK